MRRLNLRHILCPIDFSSLTSGSLTIASAMARAREAELRALHVQPSEGVGAPAGLGSLERQTLMSRLRTSLAEAAPSYDLVGAAVRQGDPGTQILRFARAMPADLIVMGAPGADRPERPIGPVTSVVVARSECPVLTVPTHHATWSNESGLFGRIVCAVDLAPSSVSVIHQALSLAWETGGRLTYVCVLPEGVSRRSAAARDRLLEAIPPEASSWCETEVLVSRGTASTEIVRIADEQKADLVVIGAPRRWTSTTHAVLSRSLCPVLATHDARPLPRPTITRTHDKVHTAV
jgi:nucleotide-binding universal stress UspA family protein